MSGCVRMPRLLPARLLLRSAFLLGLILLALMGFGQIRVHGSYLVEEDSNAPVLSLLSPAPAVLPGEFATLVLSIGNYQTITDLFRIEVQTPPGWDLIGVPEHLELGAGDTELLFLTLAVPYGVAAGTYVIGLDVYAAHAPWTKRGLNMKVEVRGTYRLAIRTPDPGTLRPGQVIEFLFHVRNLGNQWDEVLLAAVSIPSWPVEVTTPSLALSPLSEAAVRVKVHVPRTAHTTRHHLTLRATSIGSGASVEGTVTSRVLPPTPDQIERGLNLRVPSTLTWNVGTGLAGGGPDIRLAGATVVPGGQILQYALRSGGHGDLTASRIQWGDAAESWELGSLGVRLSDLLYVEGTGLSWLGRDGTEAAGLVVAGGPFTVAIHTLGHLGQSVLSEGMADRLSGSIGTAFLVTPALERAAAALSGSLSFSSGAGGGWAETRTLSLQGEIGTMLQKHNRSSASSVEIFFRYGRWGTHVAGRTTPGLWRDSWESTRIFTTTTQGPLGPVWVSVGHVQEETSPFETFQPSGRKEELRAQLSLRLQGVPATTSLRRINRAIVQTSGKAENEGDDALETVQQWQLASTYGERPLGRYGPFDLFFSSGLGLTERLLVDGGQETETKLTLRLNARSTVAQAVISTECLSRETLVARGCSQTEHSFGIRKDWPSRVSAEVGGRLVFAEGLPTTLSTHARGAWPLGAHSTIELHFSHAKGLGGGDTSWRIGGRWVYHFSFPTPVPVYGQVTGQVIDPDEPDAMLSHPLVLSLGATKVSTDSKGYFIFPPVWPGTYTLTLDEYPAWMTPLAEAPQHVTVEAGERPHVLVKVARSAAISGRVEVEEVDVPIYGQRPSLPSVRVELWRDDRRVAETYTHAGRFSFTGLLPGKHEVRLDPAWIPPGYAINGPAVFKLSLERGSTTTLRFGLIQKLPELEILPLEPTAGFSVEPTRPRVGEPVRFIDQSSADMTRHIVSWTWEFGDGNLSYEAEPRHIFDQPGTYTVRLTIQDSGGQTDQIERQITVVP